MKLEEQADGKWLVNGVEMGTRHAPPFEPQQRLHRSPGSTPPWIVPRRLRAPGLYARLGGPPRPGPRCLSALPTTHQPCCRRDLHHCHGRADAGSPAQITSFVYLHQYHIHHPTPPLPLAVRLPLLLRPGWRPRPVRLRVPRPLWLTADVRNLHRGLQILDEYVAGLPAHGRPVGLEPETGTPAPHTFATYRSHSLPTVSTRPTGPATPTASAPRATRRGSGSTVPSPAPLRIQ